MLTNMAVLITKYSRCWRTRVDKCRLVLLTYTELYSVQVNLYTIFERSDLEAQSLDEIFNVVSNFERSKCQFKFKIFAIPFCEHTHLTLGKIRKVKKWWLKINNIGIFSFYSNKTVTETNYLSPGQTLSTFHYTMLDMHVE